MAIGLFHRFVTTLFQPSGRPRSEEITDNLAYLMRAASDDPSFRKQVEQLVCLPDRERIALIRSAVSEMAMRNEDPILIETLGCLAEPRCAVAAQKVFKQTTLT
jgi:hypothetical protein